MDKANEMELISLMQELIKSFPEKLNDTKTHVALAKFLSDSHQEFKRLKMAFDGRLSDEEFEEELDATLEEAGAA